MRNSPSLFLHRPRGCLARCGACFISSFILNLLFNAAYTPIQFGLKNNLLASVDILLVLGTLLWALKVIWPRVRWVAYVNIPYLLWVAFATLLQLSITWLNR